jgi:hypothetical protein
MSLFHRPAGLVLAALVAMVAMGCERGARREEIRFRLDQRHFPSTTVQRRAPLVQIGDEVRPVPFARARVLLATVERVPLRDGPLRAAIRLPPDVREFPPSTLSLGWTLSGGVRFNRVERGWRLRMHPHRPGRGKIVVNLPFRQSIEGDRSLRLEGVRPMPARLESEPFDLPLGATIELGYGLASPKGASPGSSTTFAATVDCARGAPYVLVETTLKASDPASERWYDAGARYDRGARNCRLVLEARSVGADAGDPVWSVPRVRAPVAQKTANDLNVVLISLDTLRADHLSSYGYARRTSPAIDGQLVDRGTTFTDASSTYPRTNYAHLGIFTGVYPADLPAGGVLPLATPIRTMAEALSDAGFATVGITEDGLVSSGYGLAWGFDEYVEHPADPALGARRVFAQGEQVLHAYRDRRFFLFLHTYKVHAPYKPSEAFRDLFPPSPGAREAGVYRHVPERYRHDLDEYDRCIRDVDEQVADFLKTLDALGLAERTLVVVLADHGEAFGEHGFVGHGFSPHQEALRVPLVFRGPGILAGHRVATPVSLVDVAPTVLDLLGLPIPPEVQGLSLRPALLGRGLPKRPLFFGWLGKRHRGVRFGSFKLIQSGVRSRVFQLDVNPYERGRGQREAPGLMAYLERYDAEGARRRAMLDLAHVPSSVSPDVQRSLRALGYVD